MKRTLLAASALLFSFLLLGWLSLPAAADVPVVTVADGGDEEDLREIVPNELLPYFTDENGRFRLPDLKAFLAIVLEMISFRDENGKEVFTRLAGIVVLCGVFALFEDTFRGKKAGVIFELCTFLAGAGGTALILRELFLEASAHLSKTTGFLSVVLPLYTSAQIAMGGVSSASVASIGLQMRLALLSEVILGLLLPLLQVVFLFDVLSVFTKNDGTAAIADAMRKLMLTTLTFLGTVIVTAFSFQTQIAARTDSLSLRAFRYTAGNLIPYVGNAVSESSKTLLSGLELLRATVGSAAIFVILLMILPILVKLLVWRFLFMFLQALSKLTSCKTLQTVFSCGTFCAGGLAALTAISGLLTIVSFAVSVGAHFG